MFTEGLDSTAVNWVREGTEVKRDRPKTRSPNMDPVYNGRSTSKSFGLPPPQLRSVHLRSGLMPTSRPAYYDVEEVVASEDEESSISGDENDSGRYSGDSSPQDDPLLHQYREFENRYNGNGMARRSMPPVRRRETYTGDYLYPYDRTQLHSRMQQLPGGLPESQHSQHQQEFGAGDLKYSFSRQQDEYVGDESSDDAESFEEADGHLGRNGSGDYRVDHSSFVENIEEDPTINGAKTGLKGVQQRASEFVLHSQPSPMPQQGLHKSGAWPKTVLDMEMPSAPPMGGSETETIGTAPQNHRVFFSGSSSNPDITEAELNSGRPQESLYTAFDQGLDRHHRSVQGRTEHCSKPASGNAREAAGSCRQSTASASQPPTFHLSGQGAWQALIAYEACVRLCLRAWASGRMEAPEFLHNECIVLRNAFGLQQTLLQPEEELLRNGSTDAALEGSAPKPKKTIGRIKVQVRKVKIMPDVPSGCSFRSFSSSSVNMECLRSRSSNFKSTVLAGWEAVRKIRVRSRPPLPATYSQRGLAYMQASAEYVREVSTLLKAGATSLRNSTTNETTQETYCCLLRLKSSAEEEAFRVQPGSGEAHVFLPESLGDDLIVEVNDSKGNVQGRVLIQLASISDDQTDKTRWWSIYREPAHESVGKVQLFISCTTSTDEMGTMKCGPVAETVAYDLVLEVAMKVQHFQQRILRLHGSWKWLLTEFASYYGVSDSYTKLRYLSSIMDVATPTEDCLVLIHDLLVPVVSARDENTLSRQEKRILGDIEDQVEQLLSLVFENYKSLDDSSVSGLVDVFGPATGIAAPALAPAVKIYSLLHDILSPEAQLTLCSYFQAAARKRSKRHMSETDEFVTNSNEGVLMDALTVSTAYLKMKTLCMNIRNELHTDIQIHNQHILPSSLDLPNICASIYNADLCSRLRSFLVACPPSGPSPPVADLVIATADFQRDLARWNICPVKGGVDAKELFHLYIVLWIQDKRLSLLDSCKLDKVRWTGVTTQHSTTPFVEEMYERIKETLNEYAIIVCRWPEYTFSLENAIADVEKAVVEALEKQFAEVLAPLKDSMIPKKFGLQYVQKLTKRRSVCLYSVPNQLGVFLNTIKRLLDVLRPKIEVQLKSWVSCMPEGACGNMIFGERMGEITVLLRAKFKNTMQAIIEKLADNTRVQRATKIKKLIQDTKEAGGESEIRERMQPLNTQLIDTIGHMHDVFTSRVFVAICRGYWDRLGQDVLDFLENRKENRSWYKGSRITVGILDDTFASQMQRLQGHALQEKDLEPPRSVMEVRSMLGKDAPNGTDSSNYYYY